MQSLKVLLLALSVAPLALTGAGCSKKKLDPVAELRQLRDQMCACNDAKCAEGVDAPVAAWSTRNDKTLGSNAGAKAMVARIALCHDNAAGDPLAREILAALDGFRTRACACKDAECATKAIEEQNQWLLANQAKYAPTKSTKLQETESSRIAGETDQCVRKLAKPLGAGGGAAPPPPKPPQQLPPPTPAPPAPSAP